MARVVPNDPAYDARVRASFARLGFMGLLGARITLLRPGQIRVALQRTLLLAQEPDHFHGGVVATLVDNAAGYAAFSLMPAGTSVLTVEFKINFEAPATGEKLDARAVVVK